MEALPLLPGSATACSAPPLPTGPCPVCPRLAAEFEPWRQAAYWQARHQHAVRREQLLRQEIDTLQAQVRCLKQRLFGRKTESAAALPDLAAPDPSPPPPPPRPRGQPPGRPGPHRRAADHLPAARA